MVFGLPYQKIGLPYQKLVSKMSIRSCLSKIDLQKSVFFTKNRSFLSKIGLQKSVLFIKNQSFGDVETRWLGWQFLDGL